MSNYRATVSIHYPCIEASPVPNYNSKNRRLFDTVSATGLVTLGTGKILEDTVALSDVSFNLLNKNIVDTISIEDFTALILEKNLTNGVTVTDNVIVSIYNLLPELLLNASALNTHTLN